MKIRYGPGDWPEGRDLCAGMTPAATFNAVAPRWEDWNAGHFPRDGWCAGETGSRLLRPGGVLSSGGYRGWRRSACMWIRAVHRQASPGVLGALEGAARGGDHAF